MNPHFDLLNEAKRAFTFLTLIGFQVDSEKEGDYSSFTKTFFKISYRQAPVTVTINYYDLELDVVFECAGIAASYLVLDRSLYANASGMGGGMFSDVPAAIGRIAGDIEKHYESILRGETAIWQEIARIVSSPKPKRRFLP